MNWGQLCNFWIFNFSKFLPPNLIPATETTLRERGLGLIFILPTNIYQESVNGSWLVGCQENSVSHPVIGRCWGPVALRGGKGEKWRVCSLVCSAQSLLTCPPKSEVMSTIVVRISTSEQYSYRYSPQAWNLEELYSALENSHSDLSQGQMGLSPPCFTCSIL